MKKIMCFITVFALLGCSGEDKTIVSCKGNVVKTNINMAGEIAKRFDCIEYINKVLNKLTTKAYSEMAKKVPNAWGHIYKKAEKGVIAKITTDSNKLMAYKLNKLLQEFSKKKKPPNGGFCG